MDFSKLTKEELNVVKKSLFEYHIRLEEQRMNEETMSKKKFKYGDIVVKNSVSRADQLFGGLVKSDIGVVVGHYDCDGLDSGERDLYRVHFSESSPYIGIDVNTISLYDGETPEYLKNVKWNEISTLRVIL